MTAEEVQTRCLVVQNNLFNESRINTVVVCALTTNLRRTKAPGNVLLRNGESNLPKESVVHGAQLFTVDKRDLAEFVGTLSALRVAQIVNGIKLVLEPREIVG